MSALCPQFYDISPVISPRLGVFPGDIGFSRNIAMDFKQGHHLLLSSITTTLHLGAHADAPNHYDFQGVGISERNLTTYFGRCQVVSPSTPPGERVLLSHLPAGFQLKAPRILFRTLSFPNPEVWNSDFSSLSPELIDQLAGWGARLVGIDTPSIDPEAAKDLLAHHRVAHHNLAILEGLLLGDIADGLYTLMALPLKIEEADASPVRALLFTDSELFERSSESPASI